MTVDNAAAEAASAPVRASHPDDDELLAARAAAEAAEREEAGPADATEAADAAEAPAGEAERAADQQPPQGAEPAEQAGRDAARGAMIPKARFDEAVSRAAARARAEAAAEAAYWKGQADALAKLGGGRSGDGGAPALTPKQMAEKIEEDLIAKADDFDQGKISLAEFKRAELQANRQLAELRQSAPAAEDAAPRHDMRLEELTAELPKRFPVLASLTADHVKALAPLAEAELRFEGMAIDNSPRAVFALREKIAELAQTRFGGAAAPQPKPTGQPDPNKAARDKVALAAGMAPNLATIAQGKRDADPMSDERFANIDPDDWAALPDSVRKQRLGLQ